MLAALPYFHLRATRIPGILQRIAVCFLVSAVLVRTTGWRAQAGVLWCLLVGYWLLMTRVPVPGYGAGALDSRVGNLAAFVDRSLLGHHLWKGTWDPEGLLSTLPAIATTLCGVLAGHLLRAKLDRGRKTLALVVAGSAGVGLGLAWQPWFPINKSLWTSSYALVTAGLALGALALCHWLIDVRGFRRWALPLVILGTNAIAAFFLSEVLDRMLVLVPMPLHGSSARPRSVKAWMYAHAFVSWAGPVHGSWLYALTYLLGWMGVLALLYRKNIFIQI